jgi:hypothetical protein
MTGRHAHTTEHAVCVKSDKEEEKQNETNSVWYVLDGIDRQPSGPYCVIVCSSIIVLIQYSQICVDFCWFVLISVVFLN